MAALSIPNSFHKNHTPTQKEVKTRKWSRIPTIMACQRGEPIDSSGPKAKKELKSENQPLSRQLFSTVQDFGKGLKDTLSPKQKGDWMDVSLVAIAFAIYVYMSQQIVCAYCAWVATFKW